jgi:hypothetical protein
MLTTDHTLCHFTGRLCLLILMSPWLVVPASQLLVRRGPGEPSSWRLVPVLLSLQSRVWSPTAWVVFMSFPKWWCPNRAFPPKSLLAAHSLLLQCPCCLRNSWWPPKTLFTLPHTWMNSPNAPRGRSWKSVRAQRLCFWPKTQQPVNHGNEQQHWSLLTQHLQSQNNMTCFEWLDSEGTRTNSTQFCLPSLDSGQRWESWPLACAFIWRK